MDGGERWHVTAAEMASFPTSAGFGNLDELFLFLLEKQNLCGTPLLKEG